MDLLKSVVILFSLLSGWTFSHLFPPGLFWSQSPMSTEMNVQLYIKAKGSYEMVTNLDIRILVKKLKVCSLSMTQIVDRYTGR